MVPTAQFGSLLLVTRNVILMMFPGSPHIIVWCEWYTRWCRTDMMITPAGSWLSGD